MDIPEYLWRMYNEHRTQQRHHETQRSAVTTATLALAGAVVAFLSQTSTLFPAWPLGVFLIVLGLFGAAFSLKQAERSQLNAFLAQAYRRRLEEELETRERTAQVLNSLDLKARQEHRQKWTLWTAGVRDKGGKRDPLFRLYWFFVVLNLLVVAAGIVILVLTV